jgi:glycosyltransferase involved in cell wall biosynthesis
MNRTIDNKIRVLYIIGEDTTTSIPLEVAGAIDDDRVQLLVAAYYGGDNRSELVDIPVIHLDVQGPADLRGPYKVYECIRKYQPDVVHVHHTVSAFWGSILGKVFGGAQIVRTEHDDHRYYSIGQHMANLISIASSDMVICNSKDTYNNLKLWEQKIARSKFDVVYNGIDIDRIDRAHSGASSFRKQLGVPEDYTLIGSVGRLIPQKNFEALLRSMPNVLESEPEVHLAILGEGPRRDRLEHVIEEESLERYVTLFGEVSRDDVFSFLHASDLFVVPSSWEGFCNAAVEAMAAGKPMVVSDISTLREVVGEAAVFVDADQPTDICKGILHLIGSGPESLRSIGRRLRERAIGRYSLSRTSEKYVENYLSVATK